LRRTKLFGAQTTPLYRYFTVKPLNANFLFQLVLCCCICLISNWYVSCSSECCETGCVGLLLLQLLLVLQLRRGGLPPHQLLPLFKCSAAHAVAAASPLLAIALGRDRSHSG
jgi:hypothetical protein